MFTVYDSKAELYMPPFYNQSTGQAVRAFDDTCNQKDHPFWKHPEDYTLFEIGSYDDNTCTIKTINKQSLGTALEYKHLAQLIENEIGPDEREKIEVLKKGLQETSLQQRKN